MVADVGRQGDAGGLEQGAGDAGRGRAQDHLLAGLVDLDFLQAVEVAQHVAPLRAEAGGAAPVLEFLAQHERQEGTEDVAARIAASEEW